MAINFSQVTAIGIPGDNFELSYLYFNGTDNYIPTGNTTSIYVDSTIEVDFELSNVNSGVILGGSGFYIYVSNGSLKYITSATRTVCELSANTRYRLTFRQNRDVSITVSLYQGETEIGTNSITSSYYDIPHGVSLYLMARNAQGNAVDFAQGKVYSYTTTSGANVYTPYYNQPNNILGLYCNADGKTRTFQGTVTSESKGPFVIPSSLFPYRNVRQITNSNNVVLWRDVRLVSITLSGQTTTFNVGDTFSFGGTVTASYSNGTTADVTNSTTFSGYDMSTAGTQTVTATYIESGITQTATYTITVTSATWHTIWSGNVTATVLFDSSHAGTAYGAGDIVSTSSLRAGVPTKVSFNNIDAASSSKITKRGTSSGSWNVSSPQSFTSAAIGQDLLYMNLVSTTSSSCKNSVSLYTKTGGKIGIWIGNISGNASNYPQTRINFTRIEQYW